jgi:hypothetical protein
MFTSDRYHLRKTFVTAWQNALSQKPLSALEQQIVTILSKHPEYHSLMVEEILDKDYLPEHGQTNPFLHLAMHLSIEEQLTLDKPRGLQSVYKNLLAKFHDTHLVEHKMIECLGECLWEAQRDNTLPDEGKYLAKLKCIKP